MAAIVRSYNIVNEKGMHARAAAKFVEVVERHNAGAEVFKDGVSAFGDSLMGLLMLTASNGTSIEVHLNGEEAQQLGDALEELISQRFHEKY